MQLQNRFQFGFAPETGKKADLMFVQHMIASLKANGRMATIMPHGVLFRGGAEKAIRQGIVDADLLEAIISLPPALFYGTGIPACVLVVNKNKPDALRNKIFFINADAEYGEGKVQNFLRPEDIEKIDFVFTHKMVLPKYSRLVPKEEIAGHEYNLNIRRYVDNTPEPEPEDVRAHLSGGIPAAEIEAQQKQFQKFSYQPGELFEKKDELYHLFRSAVAEKQNIKTQMEADAAVVKTFATMQTKLNGWWNIAKEDFAKLAPSSSLSFGEGRGEAKEGIAYFLTAGLEISNVRLHLLTSLKEALLSEKVLDEFQVAGVFVNWWSNIKYDLKTISNSGWNPSLIEDDYFIEKFFQKEKNELQQLEQKLAEQESALQEKLEQTDYESEEEDESGISLSVIKKYLKQQLENLMEENAEAIKCRAQLDELLEAEKEIKTCRAQIEEQEDELTRKINYKRFGIEEAKEEYRALIEQVQGEIKKLDSAIAATADKKEKQKMQNRHKRLESDYHKLQEKTKGLVDFLSSIGGVITEAEAKELILQKHNRLVQQELFKYLNAEKRKLIAGIEKLWDKYAVSSALLEKERGGTLATLNKFLTELNYLN